jgi:bifunctional DNase/RNase
MENICKGYGIKPLQVVIFDVEETTYFARLFLQQEIENKIKILELDARPSDCLTLALMGNIPIYCKKTVMEKAIPVSD